MRIGSSLGAGLVLAFNLPGCSTSSTSSTGSTNDFMPKAWVRISPSGDVTAIVGKSEMGQGVAGLPTILGDELDAPFDRVKAELAIAAPQYADPAIGLGPVMVTGGSTSLTDMWMPLRNAGATARTMLVAAAAKQWGVDPSSCRTHAGSVYHDASNRSAPYASLVEAAKAIPVPQHVVLKSPEQFTLIGKPVKRTDIPAKVNGTRDTASTYACRA
ncbi:MAG: molybdopterin cofactor-binding domain-containing protein [Vulcanimicrobiaceae bacterium]